LLDRLGAGALVRANDYTWTNLGRTMSDIYRNVLSESKLPSAAAAPARPGILRRAKPAVREAVIWSAARAAAGMYVACGTRAGNRFGILTYHRVTSPIAGLPTPTWNTPASTLRRQLEGLLLHGFQPWPLSELINARETGRIIPPQAFAVTFDDGYENNLTEGLSVLEDLGVPATIFLATDYLDRTEPFPFDDWSCSGKPGVPTSAWRPLTSEQCHKLLDSGLIELGTHTHRHQKLINRLEDFRSDLSLSIDVLRNRFGVKNPSLAFPHGLFNQQMLDIARDLGVRSALTTIPASIDLRSDPLGWGRFSVESHDTAATLAGKLSGWYTPITRMLRTLIGSGTRPPLDTPATARPTTESGTPEASYEPELVSCD
jgi:peptidoglycan/xylan/chitin deacetylase (PgdA/CDA1 family)